MDMTIIICCIMFASWFFWFVYNLLQFQLGRASSSWPTVVGTILEYSMYQTRTHRTKWKARVRYEYVVRGQAFEGDRIAFGYAKSTLQSEHQEILNTLRSNTKVLVYYQPQKPRISALTPGFHRSSLYVVLCSISLFLIAAIGFVVLLKSPDWYERIWANIEMIH